MSILYIDVEEDVLSYFYVKITMEKYAKVKCKASVKYLKKVQK